MKNIYTDGEYQENNATWHEQDSPWKARMVAKMFSRNGLKPATVCEVGCGAGGILQQVTDELGGGVVGTGYEISPQAYELCLGKSRDNLTYVLGDLLADDDAHFDAMLCIDVFEHVEDYMGFLTRLRPKASSHVFHIPLDLSVQTVFRQSPLARARATVGHLHYYTKETALATLEHTGYEVIDHFYTRGALELPNRGWKANLLRAPRSLMYRANRDMAVRLLGGFSLMVLTK